MTAILTDRATIAVPAGAPLDSPVNAPSRRPNRARVVATMFGPAFVAAVAYVDPGNFSTNFAAGAKYGYQLVWVVLLANLMAMPMQFVSAKIGIATGQSLPEICRNRCSRPVAVFLWIQAELVAIATDLAEFIGGAIGLNLLFGVPPLMSGAIIAIAAFALLALQTRGARPFERAVTFLLILVVAGFLYQLLHTGADEPAMIAGLLPSLPDSGAVYLAAGIVGATMMPHVVYLHSSMTAHRDVLADDVARRRALRFEKWDVIVALGIAGAVNLVMLIVAAKIFFHSTLSSDTLADIHHGIGRVGGGGVALAFAGALLVSGISSSGVGTLAGQTVMSGFVGLRIPLYLRRAITMAPALIVLALGVNATTVLTFSQVALSFGIPCALVPLIGISRSRAIMGEFVNSRRTTIMLTGIAVIVVLLNVALIGGQFLP